MLVILNDNIEPMGQVDKIRKKTTSIFSFNLIRLVGWFTANWNVFSRSHNHTKLLLCVSLPQIILLKYSIRLLLNLSNVEWLFSTAK